jgi:ATP synthase mitochondrial F1 complex assembly factor 2
MTNRLWMSSMPTAAKVHFAHYQKMNRLLIRSVCAVSRMSCRMTSANFGLTNRDRKRFYKNVSVVESTDEPSKYEIRLDQRHLKSPMGNVIRLDNEFLVSAIAQEWHQQAKNIDLSSMHVNSLMNTLIDNPLKITHQQLLGKIMSFLDWDTLLFRCEQPEELCQLQIQSWDPILNLINQQFQTQFRPTNDLDTSNLIRSHDRSVIEKYLRNYDLSSLTIFLYMVEQLKSVLLSICLVKQLRPAKEIASLSRLETEFQISRWSNVEYHHDYELMDTCSKISAAYLVFYCLNNNVTRTTTE